ncbi:zinc finger 3 homolog [Paramuricea clavata]|uniref:Zinc finger 3 homolog n=1 Tax=Paramuricea clavata TaxID=317549 RepID=A0A7D9ETU1_PARCT|nr:zinc finger 3 homolog [Paramuricea clavata]
MLPTSDNPADLASRGGQIKQKVLWENGAKWLQDKSEWPDSLVTKASPSSEMEAKATKELLNVVNVKDNADQFDRLLECLNLRRACRVGVCRVGVWIKRFIHNCRNNKGRSGPITMEEVIRERDWWTRCVQQRVQKEPHYLRVVEELGLRTNADNILIVHGGKTMHVIDGINTERSNWIRYVNCAQCENEQNRTAYQYEGEIYYRVYKEIEAGSELLVWYGDEYGEELVLLMLPPNQVDGDGDQVEIGEKEFRSERLQETLVLLNNLVRLVGNVTQYLKLSQVEVLCRLVECLITAIDLQKKGIDIEYKSTLLEHENDPGENLSTPYQLADIPEMSPLFKEQLALVEKFMNARLSKSFAEWNLELLAWTELLSLSAPEIFYKPWHSKFITKFQSRIRKVPALRQIDLFSLTDQQKCNPDIAKCLNDAAFEAVEKVVKVRSSSSAKKELTKDEGCAIMMTRAESCLDNLINSVEKGKLQLPHSSS